MTPDDPRHGTNAGHVAGCREQCCRIAHNVYRRSVWRKRYSRGVDRLLVDSIGSQRRVQALQARGWRLDDIVAAIGPGIRGGDVKKSLYRMGPRIHVDTASAIAEVYERLSMQMGPSALLRAKARNWGWPQPLCWDDIDNDPAPIGLRNAHRNTDYDSQNVVDDMTVERLLLGERVPSNRAEKVEAMRRWLAAGKSERSLCQMHGWRDGRYVTREDVA